MMIAMGTLVFMLAAYHPELVPEPFNVYLGDTEDYIPLCKMDQSGVEVVVSFD
ncbi:unnamed protein product [Arabidopsis halleri]